jgi:hypothetical protein
MRVGEVEPGNLLEADVATTAGVLHSPRRPVNDIDYRPDEIVKGGS